MFRISYLAVCSLLLVPRKKNKRHRELGLEGWSSRRGGARGAVPACFTIALEPDPTFISSLSFAAASI